MNRPLPAPAPSPASRPSSRWRRRVLLGAVAIALALGGCGYEVLRFGAPDATAIADILETDAAASDVEPPGEVLTPDTSR